MVTGNSDQLYSNSWTDPQTNHEEAALEQVKRSVTSSCFIVSGGESSSCTRINGFSARQWLMYLSRSRFKVREDDTAQSSKQYLAKRRLPRHQAECCCFWINLAYQLHDEVVLNRSPTTVWSRVEWTVWRWTRYQYVLRSIIYELYFKSSLNLSKPYDTTSRQGIFRTWRYGEYENLLRIIL